MAVIETTSPDRDAVVSPPHEVYTIDFACQADAAVEFFDMLYGETARDGERYRNLTWMAVHGVYVAEIHDGGLITEMLQRYVGQIEVNPFDKEVG